VQVACVNLSFVQSREFVLETNDSQVLKIWSFLNRLLYSPYNMSHNVMLYMYIIFLKWKLCNVYELLSFFKL
jgi:hypothetical protein